MSTSFQSPVGSYHPSLFSSNIEQGSLSMEISRRTDSRVSNKPSGESCWLSPLDPSAAKDSFLAFCIEVLRFNLQEENEDEEDKISDEARDAALSITQRAYARMPGSWLTPYVDADGSGGVRLSWKHGNKELRAVFPNSTRRTQYLYWENSEKHWIVPNFTAETLCNGLDWDSSQWAELAV